MNNPVYPEEAIKQLRVHQEQLDMDGTKVGVSRQALDEVLDYAYNMAIFMVILDNKLTDLEQNIDRMLRSRG